MVFNDVDNLVASVLAKMMLRGLEHLIDFPE